MDLHKLVLSLNEIYFSEVKPGVLNRDYGSALAGIHTMKCYVDTLKYELVDNIHSGWGYSLEVQILFDKIKNESVGNRDLERFEAFAAQTRLPKG
jgi:hypothetical protein